MGGNNHTEDIKDDVPENESISGMGANPEHDDYPSRKDEYEQMVQEMNDIVNELNKRAGPDAAITKKMRQIFDIMASITPEEMDMMDEYMMDASIEKMQQGVPNAGL